MTGLLREIYNEATARAVEDSMSTPTTRSKSDLPSVDMHYTNYKGESALRTLIPKAVRFGTSEWHADAQWLLLAFDVDKQAEREFAMRDFGADPVLTIGESFSCTSDHAVEAAFVLSCAEASMMKNPDERREIGNLLADYAAGRTTTEDIVAALAEISDEAMAGDAG